MDKKLHPGINPDLDPELKVVASAMLYEEERAYAVWQAQGEQGTCPYDPKCMLGWPIGMTHCPICGEMVLAGLDHINYNTPA